MRVRPLNPVLEQGPFEFFPVVPVISYPPPEDPVEVPAGHEETEDEAEGRPLPPAGTAHELEEQARRLLLGLDLAALVPAVHVSWNPRLKSTAGYAAYPSWRIELNPLLVGFDGQVDRTLRHELAHLVAYYRAGRRRIEPHGEEWRQACADLGIPGEPAHHRLPLPRSRQERSLAYECPHCKLVIRRVRAFKRSTACLNCCRVYNRGQYHEKFRFLKLAEAANERL
jgi:predicted SprT family Zn-dependent metalloprotease